MSHAFRVAPALEVNLYVCDDYKITILALENKPLNYAVLNFSLHVIRCRALTITDLIKTN